MRDDDKDKFVFREPGLIARCLIVLWNGIWNDIPFLVLAILLLLLYRWLWGW